MIRIGLTIKQLLHFCTSKATILHVGRVRTQPKKKEDAITKNYSMKTRITKEVGEPLKNIIYTKFNSLGPLFLPSSVSYKSGPFCVS